MLLYTVNLNAQVKKESFPPNSFFEQKWEEYLNAFTNANYERLGNQFHYPVTMLLGNPMILNDKASFIETIKNIREKGLQSGYSYSKTDSVKLIKLSENTCYLDAYFKRYNSSNEILFNGRGLYFFKKINNEWKIQVNMPIN